MKKTLLLFFAITALLIGCSKSEEPPAGDFDTVKNAAIANFVNVIALPAYSDLRTKAAVLTGTLSTLRTTSNEENLASAKTAWKDMRSTWEKTEGFLFGPVDDLAYAIETDTSPVKFIEIDNLLASAQPVLTTANIAALARPLKGYHPIEYMLWGINGTKTAADITTREKDYIGGLSLYLKARTDTLYNRWAPTNGNYSAAFLTAGNGSITYEKKRDAFNQLVNGMAGICDKVAGIKMLEPYTAEGTTPGSGAQLVESPFSGNSVDDFKNNIIGAYNIYQGQFFANGTGIQDLVILKNSALNVQLQQRFEAAINSFNNITVPYEQAIVSQRQQCQAAMDAISSLSTLLKIDLQAFVNANIID